MPREEQSGGQEGEGVTLQLCDDGDMLGGGKPAHPHPHLGMLSVPTETSRPHIVTPKTFVLPKGLG